MLPLQPVETPVQTPPPPVARKKHTIVFILIAVVVALVGVFLFIVTRSSSRVAVQTEYAPSTDTVRYLAFQLFTDVSDSKELEQNFPTTKESLDDRVATIVKAVGTVGGANNKLGFMVGPIAFDNDDEKVRQLIRESFAVALKYNVATGFHIDDSMFWGRLTHLRSIENIEWMDWQKTPNTGRRLDWSATPTKLMPQLCVNSPAVVAEIKKRSQLIGEEVQRGIAMLAAEGKEDLFLGVGAGWETMIGRDFATGKYLGYCALTNKGYSAQNPPADIDGARVAIVKEFIDLWTASLADAGVPSDKIYSHIALMPQISSDAQKKSSYLESINFTPPSVAFGEKRFAGFSTYPGSAQLDQVEKEVAMRGGQPWASLEGGAIDPAQAGTGASGDSMEKYLGNLFNHGARIVNVFGWGVGPKSNPFREVAENQNSLEAYRKFLGGGALSEGTVTSGGLPDKIGKIQNSLPTWVKNNPTQQAVITKEMQALDSYIKAGDMAQATKVADRILAMMGL